MTMLLRHLLAIVVLPFTVTVLVPWWIARDQGTHLTLGGSAAEATLQGLGACVAIVGLWLFGWSMAHFARRGRGTLAPWDPPPQLVVSGPYCHVRNPMISGVFCILMGEALVLLSLAHATWALAFVALNATYIPLVEEPMLEARFGDSYRRYKRNVRRLVPRVRPWDGSERRSAEPTADR